MPVKCSFVFKNLTDAAEVDRVKKAIQAKADGGAVEVTTGEAGMVTMAFTLADVTALPKLAEQLKYKTSDSGKALAFEESGRQVSTSFRTVAISGSVKVTLQFTISPGAKLFYSGKPGEETEVPADKIDASGNVKLDAPIARGQGFVYARTVLGAVEKCIKVDIYDSSVTQISRAAYDAHQ
jgi:hypothetical protein